MKCIIGVDLRETAAGALHYAAWLASTRPDTPPTLVPVHVLEEAYLLQVLRHAHLEAVERLALDSAVAQVRSAGLEEHAEPVRVVRGAAAEDALVREFDAAHADLLVIGRQAPSTERNLVRLGRVARRLVRTLPCPLVVVPPDLRAESIGKGPIMLATDLDDTSAAAARFARRLAEATGRPLVVAHVVPQDVDADRYLPSATVDQFLSQIGLDRESDLQAWMNTHHLAGHPAVVAHGDVLTRLSSMAEMEGTPTIVCGSRGLGTVERVFVASIGSDLACWAGCAVAIVPPAWGV